MKMIQKSIQIDIACLKVITDMQRVFTNKSTVAQNEPRREKTCLWGFRPCPTQIGLYSHRSRLDA